MRLAVPANVSDADFRLMADSLPHIVWTATLDGTIEYVNAQGWAYAGLRATADHSWRWLPLIHPDDLERARLSWDRAKRAPTPFQREYRIRRADGEYRWHAFRGLPVCDEHGVMVRWIGTATDVEDVRQLATDLRLAQRTTAETLALLETLQSNAPIGFGFVSPDFRFLRLNETLAALTGSTAAEQIGRSVESLIPQLWPHIEPLYRRVLESGVAILDVELTNPSPTGTAPVRHWLTSYYPVRLEAEIIGIAAVVVDITERKAGEAARQRLSAIVEGSGDAIFGATTDGTITSWNGAAERLFGYTAEEIIGQPATIIAPDGRAPEQSEMRARLSAGGPPERLETVRRRKDGGLVEVLITGSTATDEAGKVMGFSVIAHDITERRGQQRALEASQRSLAEAQRTAHLGSFEFDVLTGEQTWSQEYHRILGLDPARPPVPGLFASMVHPDDGPAVARAWSDAITRGLPFDLEIRIIRADSEERCVRVRSIPEAAEDGRIVKVTGTLLDDTERVVADRVRRTAESRFEIGFEQAGIGAAILDLEGTPIRVNAAVCAILGAPEADLVGRRWTAFSHPDQEPFGPAMLARASAGHDTFAAERRYIRPDGAVVWALLHITLVRDEKEAPQYYLAQLQDITERKQMEENLAHQALHDALTGLPNRALLTDRLFHGLAGSRRRGSQLGVMFLDVDHFKVVNDSLGHTSGDDLLRHIADRIAGSIRPGDTVARFGGDEFVIVCDDVSALETELIAERVLAGLSQPCLIGDQEMIVTASVGIAVADEHATPESLLQDSDAAMYRAKDRGRARIELFDVTLRSKVERRLAIASALGRALEREEFTILYQPIVDLETGAMVSAEALLRWNHPTRGVVSPADFIPLAEETGLIVPIGAWVLEQACRQLLQWQRLAPSDAGPSTGDLSVAVNISVRQILAPDIVGVVEDVVRRTGVCPTDLCLELTESVLMEEVDYFGRTLAGLKTLGVGLAIDDFGTGYSSLSYLNRYPVDSVKIDRAFVDALGTDPHDAALVAAILAMAEALGLSVTAEGVETREQLVDLKRLRCRQAQGFYLARPMPADQLTLLVTTSHRWPV